MAAMEPKDGEDDADTELKAEGVSELGANVGMSMMRDGEKE